MIVCKIKIANLSGVKNIYLQMVFAILVAFSAEKLLAASFDDYLRCEANGKLEDAAKVLTEWKPKSFEEDSYKRYFSTLSNKQADDFWSLYQDLSKKKKLGGLQYQCIKNIIELDLNSEKNLVKDFKKIDKIAKQQLMRMRGLPEGKEYELLYLKWIMKHEKSQELCKTERLRRLSQPELYLIEILHSFEKCPVTFDDFIYRIRMLIYSGNENRALSEIDEFSEVKKLSDWQKAYLKAVYNNALGDPIAAYNSVIGFEDEIKKNEDYYLNLFYIAQRAGEFFKAGKIIDNLIESAPNSAKKNELLYEKAFFFYQTKRYIEAAKIFSDLIKTHPSNRKSNKSKEYDNLTWLRAWCYYLAKEYELARNHLLENKKWATDKARNLYWLAQAEWALDHRMQALSYYRELALPVLYNKFFSHYNYLAWLRFVSHKKYIDSDILENLKKQISDIKSGRNIYVLPDFATNPSKFIQEYEVYFEDIGATDETFVNESENASSIDEIEVLKSVSDYEDAVEDDTKGIEAETPESLKNQITYADSLIKWGYRNLAKWHLYEVEKNISKKSAAEPLIEYYSDNKYYNRALALTNQISSPAGKLLNKNKDPLFWSSLFPKAYKSIVERESKKNKIHPYTVWSIMKAETQYKDDAISPVGAQGLMQIMPYTSQKIAHLLKEKYESDALFTPDMAIKYGATYLKKLNDELGGQLPLIAAAYNAGPHRVKLWLRNLRERDFSNVEYDIFIEHIPFSETRTYVKRVLNYNLMYQKLYEDKLDVKGTMWLTEKIPFTLSEPISLKEEWPTDKKN